MVIGFKSFLKGNTSVDGKEYKEGIIYHQDGDVIFGKRGFHLCKHIEDTFMYCPGMDKNISVAIVEAWGHIITRDDEYRGCYDMYAASSMRIVRFLSREEILEIAKGFVDFQLIKFLSRFPLSEEELKMFEGKFYLTDLYIDYYQRGIKDAFELDYKRKKLITRR